MRDDIASEAYEDELDMGRSGSYLNSSITSAWSEHSLDPEDIRVRAVSVFNPLPHVPILKDLTSTLSSYLFKLLIRGTDVLSMAVFYCRPPTKWATSVLLMAVA